MRQDMARRPVTILLVEDEALICEMTADALQDAGFRVHAVASAEQALRDLEAGVPADALVTDINLAGIMDGLALAWAARRLVPGLPVVYTSGRSASACAAGSVPGSCFVPKPYDPVRICGLVAALMRPAETMRRSG